MSLSNYPPNVTGTEWQITGQCPDCDDPECECTDECDCEPAYSPFEDESYLAELNADYLAAGGL